MLSKEIKLKIIEVVKAQEANYPSGIKHAFALGISTGQYSRIRNGETEKVLADAKWISIARKYNIALADEVKLVTARTPVFDFIWNQLEFAQQNSVSGIICDRADIGKTHTAKIYVRQHKNAVYVDCGRAKTKQAFIRKIAREFGIDNTGLYEDVFADLVLYIKTTERPLIVLDEFGDLCYNCYLEFKALWNDTDGYCGWYAMGADGLAVKIQREINHKKVGFTEIFSRLGNKFQRVTPQTEHDFINFQKKQIAQIGKANGCPDVQRLYKKTNMSLRRIPIMISLQKKELQNA